MEERMRNVGTLIRKLLPAGAVTAVLAASFVVFPVGTTLASCSGATLNALPTSPHTGGGTVVETATAACSGYTGGGYGYGNDIPVFRFWELDPGRAWSMVQDYSTTNTYNWHTTGLANGDYNLEVDVRALNEPTTDAYDTVTHLIYHIGPAPCATANLTVSGGSSATTGPTGGTFTMTGSSTGCSSPVYRFWIRDPGRAWSMVQDYSATATHTWGPVGTYHVGQELMEVDVRDASESTTYDVVHNLTYNLVGCTGATIVPVPSGGVHGAVAVTLTATATCPGTPTYRFWIRDPGSRWSLVRDYSTSNTYTWAAANQRAGTSNIEVDVRDQGSLDDYEFATAGQTDILS
jgi:hypothetical protein